jgi:Cdc6-like AAA superfamily ATPase
MLTESDKIQKIHSAFIGFALRAERASTETLIDTFVDSAPLLQLLSNTNNSITYGRRGTGKTHALRYLDSNVKSRGEEALYLDLRSIGSNTSVYNDLSRSVSERASQLIHDVLESILTSLYPIAVARIDTSTHPVQISIRLDDLQRAIGSVKIVGASETESELTDSTDNRTVEEISVTLTDLPHVSASATGDFAQSKSATTRKRETGNKILHLDFGSIQTSFAGLLAVLGVPRFWLLIDEWSEIPFDLQPYLADLLRRTILPISSCILKIAAIEHR